MQNGFHEVELFDGSILGTIDFSKSNVKQKYGLSPCNAGEGLRMRSLKSTDYDKGEERDFILCKLSFTLVILPFKVYSNGSMEFQVIIS